MRSAGISDGIPSMEVTENTPVMKESGADVEERSDPRSPRGNRTQGSRPRDRLKHAAAIKARQAQEKQESMWKFMIYCCGLTVCSVIVGVIYWIYNYYEETIEERERIDNKPTVVSEQWIDYLAPDVVAPEWPYNFLPSQVNCTNLHPCRNWDCQYVREHFHKKPDECEYDDYLTVITVCLILCLIFTTCGLIKEHC